VAGLLDGSGWGLRLLRVTTPEQVARSGLTARSGPSYPAIPLQASVNRTFLAAVIQYYIAHPEHRQEIGTQAGYERLLRDIGR
jgi:hypothetical protein